MEYLIGSLLTLFVLVVLSRTISREQKKTIPVTIRGSQAYTFNMLKPLMPYISLELKKKKATQATKHHQKTIVRVIFTENEAYWIAENKLYVAQTNDGIVDEDSVKVVDTMTMDKVQLDKMVFIVEQLTEGLTNDSSGSGD